MISLVELLFVICVWGALFTILSEPGQERGRLFALNLFAGAWALVVVLSQVFGDSVPVTGLWVIAAGLIIAGVSVGKSLQRRRLHASEAEDRA